MPGQTDAALADNLHRWKESGQPRRWVESRRGRWDHEDWLALLADLGHSSFWPLDPAAVGLVLEESRRRWCNLRRWEQSGQARQWVEARQGHWGHDDWRALLQDLSRSPFWPLDPEAVGATLEEIQQEWRNLDRWQESGAARQWVEARQGRWTDDDWLALLAELRQSQFWPLDPAAVEKVVKRVTAEWWNFRRWHRSGLPGRWVEAHQGQWSRDEWRALVTALQRSQYWPLDLRAVEALLEEARREYQNLQRWQESEEARRWVEARRGQWCQADWLTLLAELRQSEFWPLDPAAAEELLRRLTVEGHNLRRWQETGQARRWVEAQQGVWDHQDWLALQETLQRSEFWPLDPAAVGLVLEQLKGEWQNCRRWQESEQPRLWVETHQGQWNHNEWLALLAFLQVSEFWPLDPARVGEVLEQLKGCYWNLCRWQESGAARRWVEARQGQWSHADWLTLLAALQVSEFWPLDPEAVARVLQELNLEWWALRRWRVSGLARRWVEAHRGWWSQDDWLALLEALQASEFWPLDVASLGRVLEEVRAEYRTGCRWQQLGERQVLEGPASPLRQAA